MPVGCFVSKAGCPCSFFNFIFCIIIIMKFFFLGGVVLTWAISVATITLAGAQRVGGANVLLVPRRKELVLGDGVFGGRRHDDGVDEVRHFL